MALASTLRRLLPAQPARLARLLLLGTVALWGATFVLVKSALADASPMLFNFLRMALATLVLAAVNWRRLRTVTWAQARAGALAGFFLAVAYELQTLGLARTSPARSAFITGLVVIFVPALTLVPRLWPAGTRKPGLPAFCGAFLALTGLFFLTTPAGTQRSTIVAAIGVGDLLTLACAFAFATHLLALAHSATSMAAGVLATLQIAACTGFMLLVLPLELLAPSEHTRLVLTPRLLLTLVVCSVFATAAAFTVQSFAQQHLLPTQTVLIVTLEPVFAWVTSLLLLGVGLNAAHGAGPHRVADHRSLLGAGLMLSGMLAVDLLPRPLQDQVAR